MQVVNIDAQTRELGGKKIAKQLRREGRVPAVVYGGDSVAHVSVTPGEMRSLIYTPDFKIAELTIDGKVERCIVKSMQFHPVTDDLVHVDFLRIIDGQPIKLNVPLRYEGTPVGVRNGGRLVKEKRTLEIQVLPKDLLDHMTIDVSELKMGETARVRDIEVKEGVEILADGAIPVALVAIPRALKSAMASGGGADGEEGEGEEAEG